MAQVTYEMPKSTGRVVLPYSFTCERCGTTTDKTVKVSGATMQGSTHASPDATHSRVRYVPNGKVVANDVYAMESKAADSARSWTAARRAAVERTGNYHKIPLGGRCPSCRHHQTWERKGELTSDLGLGLVLGIIAVVVVLAVMLFLGDADFRPFPFWVFGLIPAGLLVGAVMTVLVYADTRTVTQPRQPTVRWDGATIEVDTKNVVGRAR